MDAEVLRIVRAVALDTARGRTMKLAWHLHAAGEAGASAAALAISAGEREIVTRELLGFLRKIGTAAVVPGRSVGGVRMQPRWRLSNRFSVIWEEVMRAESPVP